MDVRGLEGMQQDRLRQLPAAADVGHDSGHAGMERMGPVALFAATLHPTTCTGSCFCSPLALGAAPSLTCSSLLLLLVSRSMLGRGRGSEAAWRASSVGGGEAGRSCLLLADQLPPASSDTSVTVVVWKSSCRGDGGSLGTPVLLEGIRGPCGARRLGRRPRCTAPCSSSDPPL